MSRFDEKLELALSEMAQLSRYDTSGLDNRKPWTAHVWSMYPPVDKTYEVPAEAADGINDVWETVQIYLKRDFGPEYWKEMGAKDPDEVRSFTRIANTPVAVKKADSKAVRNPATQRAIEKYLNSNPAGYKWNIIITDYFREPYEPDTRKPNPKKIMQRLGMETDGHITYLKVQSSGDTLDADMLMHTAGHAVLDFEVNKPIFKKILKIVNTISIDSMSTDTPPADDDMVVSASKFLHFNAAKNLIMSKSPDVSERRREAYKTRALADMHEVVYEMMGIFAKRDRVKFSPNQFHPDPDAWRERAASAEAEINALLRQALDNCVGQIIED